MSLPQYSARPRHLSIFDRILNALPAELAVLVRRDSCRRPFDDFEPNKSVRGVPKSWNDVRHKINGRWRSWCSVPNLLILTWLLTLLWGERWAFRNSVKACHWKHWERWPTAATPHHMVLLADPQLVDPHTYPGRPWPLDILTMMHTDNYMRRSYTRIQNHLHPDTTFFLGDIFDGGREWRTKDDSMDDPPWVDIKRSPKEMELSKLWTSQYGDDYWLQEFERFSNIFFSKPNDFNDATTLEQKGRRIITGLPGNHDFGFGANVRMNARNRFEMFFGETNRVDVVGNHSIVSVDGLSLSARNVNVPEAKAIAKPVEEFLAGVPAMKSRAIKRDLRVKAGLPENVPQIHHVEDAESVKQVSKHTEEAVSKLPTILMTHVPLYRKPGAACGPLRERMPPADPPISPDERNGIPIAAGYQYQNVLSDTDSLDILDKVQDVVHVFSGDDHDYCELVHTPETGGVKEITVKSMSWAMGVRRPGFLLVSLWNPVDASGQSIGTHGSQAAVSESGLPLTIETHLCLLPDQIAIILRYAALLGVTLVVLLVRAILVVYSASGPASRSRNTPPHSRHQSISLSSYNKEADTPLQFRQDSDSSTSSTTSNSNRNPNIPGTRSRKASISTRVQSPVASSNSNYAPPSSTYLTSSPLVDRAGYYPSQSNKKDDDVHPDDEEAGVYTRGFRHKAKSRLAMVISGFWRSVCKVALVAVGWYLWLIWWG